MKNSKLIKILIISGITLSIGVASMSYTSNAKKDLNNTNIAENTEDKANTEYNIEKMPEEKITPTIELPTNETPKSNVASPKDSTKNNLIDKINDNNDTTNQNSTMTKKEENTSANNSTAPTQPSNTPNTDTNANTNNPPTNTNTNNPPTNTNKPSVAPSNPNVNKPSNDNSNNNTPNETTPSSKYVSEIEQLIFQKVNAERSKAGVPALTYNNTMQKYARIKSKDMGDRKYFDHTNPEGQLITAQMQKDGVSYQSWGENIAYISGASGNSNLASQFMTNWMNSSGHKANILSTDFSSIGIGVYKIGNTYYATQEFYR